MAVLDSTRSYRQQVNVTGLSKHVCIYKLKEFGMRENMYCDIL
jgi:hypothetical protein